MDLPWLSYKTFCFASFPSEAREEKWEMLTNGWSYYRSFVATKCGVEATLETFIIYHIQLRFRVGVQPKMDVRLKLKIKANKIFQESDKITRRDCDGFESLKSSHEYSMNSFLLCEATKMSKKWTEMQLRKTRHFCRWQFMRKLKCLILSNRLES